MQAHARRIEEGVRNRGAGRGHEFFSLTVMTNCDIFFLLWMLLVPSPWMREAPGLHAKQVLAIWERNAGESQGATRGPLTG